MGLHFLWSLLGFESSALGFRKFQVIGSRVLHLVGVIGGVLTEHAPTKWDEAMKMWNGRYLLIPALQCVQRPVIPVLFIIVEQSQAACIAHSSYEPKLQALVGGGTTAEVRHIVAFFCLF
jgi:hypothetical protein